MFLELLATVAAGVAGAGIVMILNLILGRRLPRWMAPVGAGAAMIAMTISSEYSWFSRTTENLPEGFEIIQSVENRSFFRPWTQVKPYIDRFAAIDKATLQSNPELPGQHLADLYFYGRWSPVNMMPIAVDCNDLRRAELSDGAEFADNGEIINAQWVTVSADDPILAAVCEGS